MVFLAGVLLIILGVVADSILLAMLGLIITAWGLIR